MTVYYDAIADEIYLRDDCYWDLGESKEMKSSMNSIHSFIRNGLMVARLKEGSLIELGSL